MSQEVWKRSRKKYKEVLLEESWKFLNNAERKCGKYSEKWNMIKTKSAEKILNGTEKTHENSEVSIKSQYVPKKFRVTPKSREISWTTPKKIPEI